MIEALSTKKPEGRNCLGSSILPEQIKTNTLDTLRLFRDNVMSNTVAGLKLIKLYYKHSNEVSAIINSDNGLKTRAIDALKHLSETAAHSNEPNAKDFVNNAIPMWLEREINSIIDQIVEQGSKELKAAIDEAKGLVYE